MRRLSILPSSLLIGLMAFVFVPRPIASSRVHFAEVRMTSALARALLFVLLAALSLVSPSIASGAEPQKRVLIISSVDANLPAIAIMNQAIRSTLKNALPARFQIYNEVQDEFQIPNEKYAAEMVSLLRRKYEGERIDLIIALSSPALKFLLKYQGELFSNTPIVFLTEDQTEVAGLNLGSNVTGVSGQTDLAPTLDIMLALHPETDRVVVVAGSSPYDKFWMTKAQNDFRAYESKVRFTYLTDMTIQKLRLELASQPKNSVVLFLSFMVDSAGNNFSLPEVLSFVTPTSSAPLYGVAETELGHSVVGGSVVSYEALGTRAAELALRVLAGEKPRDIPPQTVPSVSMFDWGQLRRWGIDEAKLPPGSIVRYKEFSVWELYKWRIIGGISLCILEALLIVLLLISRAKRKQAQRETKAQHRRLDEVVSNVPGLVWEIAINPDTGHRETRFVSGYVEQMLGYGPEKFMQTTGFGIALIPEEDRANVEREINEILASGTSGVIQFRWQTKDGRVLWVESHLTAIRDENGKAVGLRGVTMDISERKRAETDLQKAVEEVSKLKNQLEEENIYLREEIKLAHDFDQIVGRSDATKYVLFKIEQVAPTDTRVLITGETGTGKELVAHAIHSASTRRDRPFVKVNCAALSPTLIESELFGHDKGAFTGATARKIGRFELANGATIFLDEIGELPLELQAKLLRVIQENEFERLGSSKTIQVDARIIAATNRNLKIAVEQGSFREDLWYRLNVFPITVPPLRDRKEDIPDLVEHFVKRFAQKVGRKISSISPATMRILQDHTWPGNVRELANVVERAVINTNGSVLRVVDNFEKAQVAELSQTNKTLEEIEKEYIVRILDSTAWRIEGHKGAAKVLGLNPSTLRTRISKLGIQKSDKTLTSSMG